MRQYEEVLLEYRKLKARKDLSKEEVIIKHTLSWVLRYSNILNMFRKDK